MDDDAHISEDERLAALARYDVMNTPSELGFDRITRQIVFNAERPAIDCTVRGLCANGASLEVVSTAGIPQAFRLALIGDGLSRTCSVTAKYNRRIEVAFV